MRPLRTRITFEIVLGVVLAISLLVILHQSRRITECQRRQEAYAQSLSLLQEALRQKDLQRASEPVTEELPSPADRTRMAKKEVTIERLDRELAESRATVASLQTQLSAANDQYAKASLSADERLKKQQANTQAQLDDLQKKLDDAVTESGIAHQRVAALEADNATLKANEGGATAKAAEASRIVANLQDLDRRRDVYLTSILRRYRDITSEFRNMSSMLDTSHDPGSSACSGAVLGRIQNAVSSAEDDLRQLSELNARAQKLQKQLDHI